MSAKHSPIFCLLICLLVSCAEDKAASQEQPLDSFRGEVAATPVRTAKSERRTFDYLINATGKIDAIEQIAMVIERQGILSSLNVKEGDYVQKGKVLAELDDSESTFQLEKARIQMKNAQANFNSEILSFGSIMESGDQERIALLEDQLKSKTGIFEAEIALKEAQLDSAKAILIAPIAGRIADVKLKKGSFVKNGDELLEIISTGSLELKVKVLESDISLISLGQKAEVLPVSGGTEVTGTVRSINPKVDENGLVQVGILVSASGGLLPGMNARAIIRAPQNNTIVVPKEALVHRSGRPVVFTIENSESKWNYVEVGKDNGREVEILSGIEEGMTLITSNNLQLAHQAPIQIVKE